MTRSTLRRIALRGLGPIVIGVLVGALLALTVTALLPKRYTATSRVLVTATGVDSTAQANSRTSGTINLDTEAQLVTSAAVVGRASKTDTALTKLTFETVVSDIAVSVPPNSSVLQIAFTADTAWNARGGANAVAAAYLDDRQANAQQLLDRQKSQATQTVRSLTNSLETLSDQLAALPRSAPGRGLLNDRIGILKTQINGENSQIVALGSVQITPGRVVTAASLPDKPSSPSRTINTLSGAALGLVLGLLAAWLLLTFTRRVRRADDVGRIVDVPCLGVLGGGRAAVAEQYRHLALVSATSVGHPRRLVFAGPLDSPAVSQVATGVAEALVRAGRSVAMLRVNAQDVNGRRPRGVPLESRPDTDTVAPGEPLDTGLDRVRDDHELLVIAVGGASTSVDAAALGAVADAVVLVVEAGTQSRNVVTAIRAMDELGAPMLGVVLTRGSVDAPVSTLPLPHRSARAAVVELDAAPRTITLEPPLFAEVLPTAGDDDLRTETATGETFAGETLADPTFATVPADEAGGPGGGGSTGGATGADLPTHADPGVEFRVGADSDADAASRADTDATTADDITPETGADPSGEADAESAGWTDDTEDTDDTDDTENTDDTDGGADTVGGVGSDESADRAGATDSVDRGDPTDEIDQGDQNYSGEQNDSGDLNDSATSGDSADPTGAGPDARTTPPAGTSRGHNSGRGHARHAAKGNGAGRVTGRPRQPSGRRPN